jgi:hypothetical protein
MERPSRVARARKRSRVTAGMRAANCGYLEVGSPLRPAGGRPLEEGRRGFSERSLNVRFYRANVRARYRARSS